MEWWPRFTIWNDDQGFHMEWSYCMTKVSNALRRFPMPLETLVILLQGLLTVMDLVEVHWKPCGGPLDIVEVHWKPCGGPLDIVDLHKVSNGPWSSGPSQCPLDLHNVWCPWQTKWTSTRFHQARNRFVMTNQPGLSWPRSIAGWLVMTNLLRAWYAWTLY